MGSRKGRDSPQRACLSHREAAATRTRGIDHQIGMVLGRYPPPWNQGLPGPEGIDNHDPVLSWSSSWPFKESSCHIQCPWLVRHPFLSLHCTHISLIKWSPDCLFSPTPPPPWPISTMMESTRTHTPPSSVLCVY